MTLTELIEELDGAGLVITDPSAVWYHLITIGVDPEQDIPADQDRDLGEGD